jgi:mRNA-degrading endonuclease RelE of RelBE toxin-antitoxin system
MKSEMAKSFIHFYKRLPLSIRKQAREIYKIWKENPNHPSLHFKSLVRNFWSVRITDDYRAIGIRDPSDAITWVFIGSHSDYDKIIPILRKEALKPTYRKNN